MGCCGQSPVGSGAVSVDTCKRVNYTLGMLLGVDDFVQESAYHSARRRQLAREVLGYGTVRGLQVVVEADGDAGPRLRVTPGVALLPSGALVCVDADQCCNLNDWLASRAELVAQALADDSPPADLRLHVVLSSVECLTDNVPIPGEPCRSEDELMKPSRIADGFRLELRREAPAQREEDAVRDFVDWLTSIPVAVDSPPLDEAAFIAQLRAAARAWLEPTSPPGPPGDFMVGMPTSRPGSDDGLLRAAIRIWTTELRPLWIARADCGCGVQPAAADDDAVLLAALDVPLVATGSSGGWRVDDAGAEVDIDEGRRPLLLHLRMVQELIAQGESAQPGDTVVAATAFGLAPDAGIDAAYARADHSHGTPDLPALPALAGDVSGAVGANRVDTLQSMPLTATGAAAGQALLFDGSGWGPGDVLTVPPAIGGDVTGPIGNVTVARLQGRDVSTAAPRADDVLMFVGGVWVPTPLPVPAPPPPAPPAPTPAPVPAPAPAPAPAGDFVGRNKEPFEIVAAGEIQVDLNAGASSPSALRSYGDLRPTGGGPGGTARQTLINLRARVADARKWEHHIVKLTPVWLDSSKVEFRLYLVDSVKAEGASQIDLTVMLSADSSIRTGEFSFRFQVEVSRFGTT